MNTKVLFGCATLLAATLTTISPSASFAQGASNRPITVIVPFAPGGGTDVLARRIMPKIAEKLGTTTAIENKPGAAGSIGAQFVARAAPDGKTLLVGSVSEIGINPGLYPKLPYDVNRDFVAVTALAAAPMVLVVHPSSAIKTAADLVRLAKANPGKINFGSAGTGSGAHMAAELFIFETQIKLTHVPYKGTGAVTADMLGQQRDMVLFAPQPAVAGIVRSGQLVAIAQTGKTRSSAMPDVPTFIEAGIPSFDMHYWYGLVAPAKTPVETRNKIHAAASEVLGQPAVTADLANLGLIPTIATEKEFSEFIQADMAKWARVVKAANLKPE